MQHQVTLWLFVAISVARTAGASLLPETSVSSDKMMPPDSPCTELVPAEGSACDSPFNCEVGKFCCPGDDSVCVPEKSCLCDESTSLMVCYDSYYQITCPSMCPSTRPDTNDACSLDSRFLCQYGDPLNCKDVDVKFDFERQCICNDGTFSCDDYACPVPCPDTQPGNGEKCLPFAPGNCDYGTFCCPGDGGQCVPDKFCYCDGISSYCYDTFISIPCPSICPETPPNDLDSCDIDSRFQCNYGDAFTCENNVDEFGPTSFDFKKQCTCYDGIFSCYSNACPEPCPNVEPVPGSSCSPFVSYSCGYDEYCCDGAESESCVAMHECYCNYDLTTICNEPSIFCPSKCPETKPESGQICDMEQRLICRYNEGSCPASECSCVEGVYSCAEICYDAVAKPGTAADGDDTLRGEGMDDVPSSDDEISSKPEKGKKKGKKDNKAKSENVDSKGKKGKKSERNRS